jgi:hypothetical protein
MTANNTPPQPDDATRETSGQGLDGATCSPSVSDTPETDAAAGNLTGVNLCAAFETKCRQLEMERNRLKDELAFAWKSKAKADDYIQTLKNKIKNLENA